MLRVRFHGRGGHGIKTASRIFGTAAFLAGWQAQDSPVYGAERRGAAIAAFNRIDREPIRERGVVADPDLILVADETLLYDPAASVLAGVESASAVFVNSATAGPALARQSGIPCPVLTLDLITQAHDTLGRASALSAPLGAVGCALSGLVSEAQMEQAVRGELGELHLAAAVIDKNVELAHKVFAAIPPATHRERVVTAAASPMHLPTHINGPQGIPIVFAHGSSVHRHTGAWRLFRPDIDLAECTRCMICFARCPDGAIRLDESGYPVIDYDNCKGCMICYEECPIHCIEEQKEVRAW